MKGRTRVGIFGGAFDPPHLGHLLAAVYAKSVFGLDELWLVPAWRHRFDKRMSPFPVRMKWCRALIRGLGPAFRVSDFEKRIRSDGKSLHTLEALTRAHPSRSFCLVVGSDTLRSKRKWYRFADIERRFGVLVVPRGRAGGAMAIPDISSTRVRKLLLKGESTERLLTLEVAKVLRVPR